MSPQMPWHWPQRWEESPSSSLHELLLSHYFIFQLNVVPPSTEIENFLTCSANSHSPARAPQCKQPKEADAKRGMRDKKPFTFYMTITSLCFWWNCYTSIHAHSRSSLITWIWRCPCKHPNTNNKTKRSPQDQGKKLCHSPFYVKYSSATSIFFIDIAMPPSAIVILSLQSVYIFHRHYYATIDNCVAISIHSLNHFICYIILSCCHPQHSLHLNV